MKSKSKAVMIRDVENEKSLFSSPLSVPVLAHPVANNRTQSKSKPVPPPPHFHTHKRIHTQRRQNKKNGPGECGQKSFCHCKDSVRRTHPELCKATVTQCERSFCNPLCLRMAWKPLVWADCSKIPSWKGCPLFAEELADAAEAITAQFRALICSSEFSCCGVTANITNSGAGVNYAVPDEAAGRRLLDWVENKVFGQNYPLSRLPISSCKNAPRESRQASCTLCKEVIQVKLDLAQERCLPPKKALNDVAPFSLHERCLFLADRIASREEEFVHMLQKEVCSCAGCCPGECFFRLKEPEDWMGNLVENLTKEMLKRSPFEDNMTSEL
eukprot:g6060.t1